MVVAIDGVVKLRVVPNKFVQAASENHSTTEPPIVPAVSNTVPVPHLLLGVVEIMAPNGLMVASTAVRVLLTQPDNVSLAAAK